MSDMNETTAKRPLVPGAEVSDRPLVELTHVEKHYGDLHVLKDINLSVKKGEVLVIVGPSGSGKSTMCRTINRLETIDSGDIRIDGKPLPQEGKELASLRAEVGMVFQSFNLFANKTILENVTLAPIKVRHMDKKAAEDLAMDLLGRVGVASQASKMPASRARWPTRSCSWPTARFSNRARRMISSKIRRPIVPRTSCRRSSPTERFEHAEEGFSNDITFNQGEAYAAQGRCGPLRMRMRVRRLRVRRG